MSVSVSLPNEKNLKEKLTQINPLLCPDTLTTFFPQYANFTRNRDRFGIWHTPQIKQKIKQNQKKYSKVLLLLSGVAGGGKDAIREKIGELYPDSIFKIITATSRQPREGEKHALDYYFYDSLSAFKTAIKNDEFLEWVTQGSRLYGSPKVSIADALSRPEPIAVTHVEMTAWPKVDKFINKDVEEKPFIIKVFVMPHMRYNKYANEWLSGQRGDCEARMSRTLWELDRAPQEADLIISNHIDKITPFLKWQTKSLLRLIWEVLTPEAIVKFHS
jgi:guanylate kinase